MYDAPILFHQNCSLFWLQRMWRVWIHYTFLAPQYKRFLTSFDELLESNFLELGGNKMSVPKRSISHCCRYFTYLVCTHVAAQKFIWFRYLFSYLSTNYYTTKKPTYLISICYEFRHLSCLHIAENNTSSPPRRRSGSAISFQISFHQFLHVHQLWQYYKLSFGDVSIFAIY